MRVLQLTCLVLGCFCLMFGLLDVLGPRADADADYQCRVQPGETTCDQHDCDDCLRHPFNWCCRKCEVQDREECEYVEHAACMPAPVLCGEKQDGQCVWDPILQAKKCSLWVVNGTCPYTGGCL